MIHINTNHLNSILSKFQNKKILVVGDIMIDEYLWGRVNRLSPEAPVPVIDIESESLRFGGAANVALNLKTLGCIPIIIGIIGKDTMADQFLELMGKYNLITDGIIQDSERPTTVKTRIIGDDQHIARVDREKIIYISGSLEDELKNTVSAKINNADRK
ncbi:MAG: PfkB family carbohydrate kinase [Calditrichaceae bacterium]